MLKVARKRKRKERKKEEKRTNSIARIRARASPPAVSFACLKLHNPGGGGTPHMKGVGMLVVSFRGVNFGFWSHLGCSGQNAHI